MIIHKKNDTNKYKHLSFELKTHIHYINIAFKNR